MHCKYNVFLWLSISDKSSLIWNSYHYTMLMCPSPPWHLIFKVYFDYVGALAR